MGLSTTFTLKFSGAAVQKGLSKVQKSYRGMEKSVMQFGKSLVTNFAKFAAIAAPLALTAGFIAFAKSSSEAASSVESLTTQFETLLGSAGKAKERMEEITKFAAKTPFEIEGLARTSKLLQTLGGDMLATGKGLTLVGDAAALAGQPLEEVGLHVGRLFNAITSGTSAGESVNRLQELGLITGKVKLEFERLAVSQKKGEKSTLTSAQALALLQGVLSKTEGAMERLSATTEGKLSNLSDNISQVKVAFGTGFNDGLKIALDAMNNGIPKLQGMATQMGKQVGLGIAEAVEGDTDRLVAIGVMIGKAMKGGIKVGLTAATMELGEGWWKFLEDVNPIRQIPGMDSPENRTSEYIKKGKGGVVKDQMAEAIEAIRAEFANIRNTQPTRGTIPGRPDLRYAQPNEPTILRYEMDGKMIRVLESIDLRLAPQP